MVYTSCFIGIPLPLVYTQEFRSLINRVSDMNLGLRMVNPQTPHITLYYLDQQSQYDLEKIAHVVTDQKDMVKHARITIGGMGVFDNKSPRVLYLDVQSPPPIRELHDSFRDELNAYYPADNNLSFHPHMTFARIPDNTARNAFHRKVAVIEGLCRAIHWSFPITELVVYGVDPTIESKIHQDLFRISMK